MALENDTFDSLVSQISTDERNALYQKLNATADAPIDDLSSGFASENGSDLTQIDIAVRYKSEPLIVRIICFVTALLFSKKKEDVYRGKLLDRLGRGVIKNCPGIYDLRTSSLKGESYDCFNRLAESASFFRDLLSRYTAERGDFYVVLSSVLVPPFYNSLSSVIDLVSVPFTVDSPAEIRQSVLRKVENAFSTMDDESRSIMYNAVRSLEWLRKFSMVQYSRIASRFSPDGRGGFQCRIDLISDELQDCVNVLCNPRNVSIAVLQALFLFNNQVRIEQKLCDEESEYHAFISAARDYLANIRLFLNKIPVLEITRLAVHDCNFVPRQIASGEDWFTSFKNAWKKRFEVQWGSWSRRHKKWQVQERICQFLQTDAMPVLKYHPWQEVKDSLFFRRELSFVFLMAFFEGLYAEKVNKPLKLIMMSGEFYKRENYIVYTDAYNALDRLGEDFKNFEERLSPKGSIGSVFHEVLKDKIITLSGKHRIDSLMLTIDADSASLINETVNVVNTMKDMLATMTQRDGAGMREVLSNIRILENTGGKQFYREVESAYGIFIKLLDIARDLESMELES